MNFLYPIGFLALLGVPVLILIYIIKYRAGDPLHLSVDTQRKVFKEKTSDQ